MARHHLEEGLPRQRTLELEQWMIVIYINRDELAGCACAWTDARRTIAVFFHDVLLRCNGVAYLKAYQKEQQLLNPRQAHCAPWVGSAALCLPSPLRDMLYLRKCAGAYGLSSSIHPTHGRGG